MLISDVCYRVPNIMPLSAPTIPMLNTRRRFTASTVESNPPAGCRCRFAERPNAELRTRISIMCAYAGRLSTSGPPRRIDETTTNSPVDDPTSESTATSQWIIIWLSDERTVDARTVVDGFTLSLIWLAYLFTHLFVCLIDGVGTVLFIALITRRSQSVITHAGKNPAWLAYGNIAFCLKTDTDPLWPWPLTFWP